MKPKPPRAGGFANRVAKACLALLAVLAHAFTPGNAQTAFQLAYAVIAPDQTSNPLVGTAFHSWWNERGVLLSELNLEAVKPVQAGRLFITGDGWAQTGLAFVNPSDAFLNVQFTLRRASGTIAAVRTESIGPEQHRSFVIEEFFDLDERFDGSLTFETGDPGLAAAAARLNLNFRTETVLTNIPIIDLSETVPTGNSIVPHLAAGQQISTQIILVNTGRAVASGKISLFSDDGEPLQLALDGTLGSEFDYRVEPAGVFRGELTFPGGLRVGSARVTSADGAVPAVIDVFQFRFEAGLISEAAVHARPATRNARVVVDRLPARTGVALANTAADTAQVRFDLFDSEGAFLGSAFRTLPPAGHAALFVDELFSLSPAGFGGVMEIDSDSDLGVTALKLTLNSRHHPVMATLPVVDMTQQPAAGTRYLPQFAWGPLAADFYSTRAILINPLRAAESTGSVEFRRSGGGSFANAIGCGKNSFPFNVPAGGVSFEVEPCWPAKFAFVKSPADRPVLDAGRSSVPLTTFDPFVLAESDGYHMFWTSVFCRKGGYFSVFWNPADLSECDLTDTIGATAYAFSSDRGRTWQVRERPVFRPSSGGWDSSKVETPNLVRVDDTLFLFYSADASGFRSRFQIGVTSLDLSGQSIRDTFLTTHREFPATDSPLIPFETTRRSFTNNVQEPSVVFRDGRFEVYFTGLEVALPAASLESAGQSIRSVKFGRRVFDAELNPLESTEDPLLDEVNIAEVRLIAEQYYLFSTRAPLNGEFHEDDRLEYRASLDGLRWSDAVPLLGKGAQGRFDDWGTMAPAVAVEDDALIVFFTAYEVQNEPCTATGPRARLGTPVRQGAWCVFSSIGRAEAPLPDGFFAR